MGMNLDNCVTACDSHYNCACIRALIWWTSVHKKWKI